MRRIQAFKTWLGICPVCGARMLKNAYGCYVCPDRYNHGRKQPKRGVSAATGSLVVLVWCTGILYFFACI